MPRQTLTGRGSVDLRAPPAAVWDALLDPGVLRATIPGVLDVERLDPGRFRATISFGVGWVAGRYTAELVLANMRPPCSLDLSGRSGGAFGRGQAFAHVDLADAGACRSRLDWHYRGTVSGPVSFAGRRLLQAASDVFVQRFFGNLSRWMASHPGRRRSVGES